MTDTMNHPVVVNPGRVNHVLTIGDEVTDSAWETLVSAGLLYRENNDECKWKLGDIADRVVTRYGESSMDAYAAEIGAASKRLYEYRAVHREFSAYAEISGFTLEGFRTGRPLATWSHFKAVMKLGKALRKQGMADGDVLLTELDMLEKASDERIKVEMFKADVRRAIDAAGGKPDKPRLKRVCKDVPCRIIYDGLDENSYSFLFDVNPGIVPGEYRITISREIEKEAVK